MNPITRSITADLLRIFLVALFGLTSVIMLIFVVQDAIRENLTPWTAIQLIPFALPGALIFSIPGTMLFAVCSVYGRLAADNEVVAIKSLGISPWVMIRPAIILSMALSFVTVYLSDVAVPWGRTGMYHVVLHSVHHTIYGALRSQRSYRKGPISIRVDDVADESLINPVFEIEGGIRLQAMTAKLECNTLKNQLVLVANNGSINANQAVMRFPNQYREAFDLGSLIKKNDAMTSPSNFRMNDLQLEYRNQVERNENQVAVLSQLKQSVALDGEARNNADAVMLEARRKLNTGQFRARKLSLEGPRRWAGGFSCLCFALVGASVAVRFRFSDMWTIFALCFLPILVVYYPVLAFTTDGIKSGTLPPLSVWAANVLIFVVGIWLLHGVLKK